MLHVKMSKNLSSKMIGIYLVEALAQWLYSNQHELHRA